ncbi:MAG TPA: sensor histidine kinase [Candidatus Angelobacter sp.]|nr:sensor histidine kinase [Candidatus Angelobacter sp.]
MRLLPKNRDIGWTPYVWLIYLTGIPAYAYLARETPRFWAITIVEMVVFLALYFRGYWVKGKPLLWIVAAITLIGIIAAPTNSSASVYFIYAASFVAYTGEAGFAIRILPVILAVIGVETWIFHLPLYFWVPAVVFSIMIGGVNIFYRQRDRDNKKLLMAQEEVEHLAKVAERERIARDLHDVLGHTLSVIVLKSELAAKLAEKDPARAASEIKEVERISREALAQVRNTVRGYQALSLQAEAEQAAATLQAAGMKVACDFAPAQLPPTHEGVLALALREAVTNVIRHSQAKSCDLRLRPVEGGCELVVKDDGCGSMSPEGAGLTGMRYRVEALGGKLQRDIKPGTRLVITLPVKEAIGH